MGNYGTKKWPILPVIGAVMVSGFIALELGAVLFCLAYMLPEGLLQKLAFIPAGTITLGFFLWLYQRAYLVELELLLRQERRERDECDQK